MAYTSYAAKRSFTLLQKEYHVEGVDVKSVKNWGVVSVQNKQKLKKFYFFGRKMKIYML